MEGWVDPETRLPDFYDDVLVQLQEREGVYERLLHLTEDGDWNDEWGYTYDGTDPVLGKVMLWHAVPEI